MEGVHWKLHFEKWKVGSQLLFASWSFCAISICKWVNDEAYSGLNVEAIPFWCKLWAGPATPPVWRFVLSAHMTWPTFLKLDLTDWYSGIIFCKSYTVIERLHGNCKEFQLWRHRISNNRGWNCRICLSRRWSVGPNSACLWPRTRRPFWLHLTRAPRQSSLWLYIFNLRLGQDSSTTRGRKTEGPGESHLLLRPVGHPRAHCDHARERPTEALRRMCEYSPFEVQPMEKDRWQPLCRLRCKCM
jgi:hypothetical protein